MVYDRNSPIVARMRKPSLDDRAIDELLGLAKGVIADGKIVKAEVEFIQKWIVGNYAARDNPIGNIILRRIEEMLKDGIFDAAEERELFDTLTKFTGSDFDLGEIQRSTTLPITRPEPDVVIPGSQFCFTGTFMIGSRRECEQAVEMLGGFAGSLIKKTDYLVIGTLATESWQHSTFGRKIEKAVKMSRDPTSNIKIITESHWSQFII